MNKDIFEEKFSNSLCINGFIARGENYPLQKAVVDHDQKGTKTIRQWKVGDEVNGELLERVSTRGGEWQECRDSGVGIYFHLLANSTASNETMDKGGHSRPPIILRQHEISAKEVSMARGEGQMNYCNNIMMRVQQQVKADFEINKGGIETPILWHGRGKQQQIVVNAAYGIKDKWVG